MFSSVPIILRATSSAIAFAMIFSAGNATAFAQESETITRDAPVTLESLEAEFGVDVAIANFQGFEQLTFKLDGVKCWIVAPKEAAESNPWIWRARFWGHQPQLDLALLKQGWHVGYCEVGNLFGNDEAITRWDTFYALTRKLGLHPKPVLEGMSRGGLIVMRWATANPNQVSGIYVDNAVMDINSWPGGKGTGKGSAGDWKQCLNAYGITEEQAASFLDGPLDRLEPLAKNHVPIFALINDADDVVPPAENSDRMIEKYQSFGGEVQVMRRPGLGHHPHSLKDPTPLVEFAIQAM